MAMIDQLAHRVNNTVKQSQNNRSVLTKVADFFTDDDLDKTKYLGEVSKAREDIWNSQIMPKLKAAKANDATVSQAYRTWSKQVDDWSTSNGFKLRQGKSINQLREQNMVQKLADTEKSGSTSDKVAAKAKVAKVATGAAVKSIPVGGIRAVGSIAQYVADAGETDRNSKRQKVANYVKRAGDEAKASNIAYQDIEQNGSKVQKIGLMAGEQVAPLVLTGGVAGATTKGALALGAGVKGAAAVGIGASTAVSYTQNYGDVRQGVEDEFKNATANQLATSKDPNTRTTFNSHYTKYLKKGLSQPDAAEQARLDTISDVAESYAEDYGKLVTALEPISAGAGKFGVKLAGGVAPNLVGKLATRAEQRAIGQAVRGQTSKVANATAMTKSVTGAIGRSAAEEGAQEGLTDWASQKAAIDNGIKDKNDWGQTKEAAVYGAILGGLFGGGANIATGQTGYQQAKSQLSQIQQTQAATNAQLNTLQQQHSQLSQVANPTPEQKQQIQAIESNIHELEAVKSDNEANAQRLNIPEPVLNKHVETPYSSTLNPEQAQTDNSDNPATPDTSATAQTASPTGTTTNTSASPVNPSANPANPSANGGFDVNQYLDLDANSLEQAWVNHQKEMADNATITDGTDQMSVQDAIEHANNTIAEENTTPQVQGGISGVVARNQQRQTQGELESEMEDWHAKKQQLQAERDAKLSQEMNTPDEPAIKLMDVNDGEHFDTTVIGLNGEPFRLANAWDGVIPAKAKQQAITTVFGGRLPQKLASASWGELHPQVQKKLHTWFTQELNNRRSEREQLAMPQLGMRTVNPQPMNELPSGNEPINLGHVAADNTPVDIPVNANSQPITFAQSEPNNQALPESGLQNLGEMENLAPSMQTELSQVDEAPTTDGAGINDKAAEIDNLIDAAKANGKYNIKNKEIILKSNGIPFSTQATLLTAIKNRKLKVDDYDIVSDGSRFVGLNKHSDLAMAPEEQLPTNDQGSTANLPSVQQDSSELPGEAKANELIDNRYIINHVAKKPGETEDVRSETVEPIERQAETLQGEPVANVAKADAPTTESKDVANEANGLITPDGNEVNATTAKNQKTSSTDSHDISQDNPAFDTENAKHSSKDNPSVNPENHAATDANITVGSATVGTEPRISEGDKPQYSKREQGEIGVNTSNRYAVVSDERARSIVSRIIDSIRSNASIEPLSHQKTGIMDFPIEVVPSFEALPEFIKQDSTFVDNDGKTQRYEVFGVWYEGKLYINSGDIRGDSQTGITTEQMYEQTILHEIVGHYGIQKLFGDSYKTQLAQLWNAIGGVPALRKIAHNNGVDMQAFERDYITPYLSWKQEEKYTADEVHQALIGEMFAHIAQNGKPTVKQRLKALVGYVRNWLRERGLMSLDKYNDSDILMFLNEAKRAAVDPKFHGKFANRKISQLNNQENNDKKNNSNIHDYSRSQSNQSEAQELIKLKRGDITIKPELLNNGKKFIDFYYRNEKLSDFLSDNPALQAYPQLGDIKVESAGFFDAVFSYDKENNTIRVPMTFTNKQMEQGVFAILKDEVANLQKGMKPAAVTTQTSNVSKEQDKTYLDLATRYEQGDTSVEPQLREMINKVAQDNGFDSDTSFRMSHAAPINDGFNDSADNLSNMFGEDIYSDNALHYFGMGDEYIKADRESLQAINRAKGKPNAMVTVYRAIPKDAKGTAIGNGDWVTTSKEYAKEHGNHALNGDYKIVSRLVPAKQLFNNGDSIHEWGVDTGQDLLRSKTVDREKLSDLITYDDKGKIIPLSKRFNAAKKDMRYSESQGQAGTTKEQVTQTLSDKFGKAAIDKLIADGNLEIIDYAEAKRRNPKTPSKADGYYADGKAVLIADNLSPDMIIPTFLHELGGHGGLQTLMNDKAYQSLMKEFDRMVAEGNPLAIEAKAFADATSPNAKVAQDEYLPYLISLAARAQGNSKVKSMLNRIVMAVKSFIRDKFGVSLKVTPADIVALAEKMVSERAMQSNATANMPTQYSKRELLAPNGKPSNLTPEQYAQVRTKEFKAWFGDWENDPDNASKVVDENGEPLVVYHATSGDFNSFDRSLLGGSTYGNASQLSYGMTAGLGFWFNSENLQETQDYGDRSIASFLNIRNSKNFDSIQDIADDIQYSGVIPEDKNDIYDFEDTSEINALVDEFMQPWRDNDYDGIIVDDEEYGGVSYVAFDPNQIKSATNNTGAFDPNNDDIRYSKNTKGATDTTPTQVRDTLVKQFGEKTIKALEDAGVLHIKQLSDFVDENGNLSIADDAEGFFHDGKAVLIADNIDVNQIVPVFLHEVGGHAGLQNMLSPNAYANLMQTFNAMVARGDEIALRAKARAELASENQDQATTEYLPYLLSEISNAQAKTPFIKRLLDRFVGAVRAWVYAKTGVRMNLTHADILGLAELTIKERARNIERTAKLIKQVNKQYSQPATNQSIDDVNKTFNDELKHYVAGKLNGSHVFKLGYPNQILKSTGFPNQPIELRASKLSEKANTEWHKFDIAEVKDLPKALEHPLAVFYYYNQARNVITQIEVGGKQLLVGIHFTQNSKGIEINDIRGLFPKDNHEWLNWITESNPKGDSKLMYVDKQKIQALIDQQRTNLAEVEYLDLDLVESIVQNFENVNIPSYSRRFAPVPQTPIPKKPTLEQAKNWLNKQWATKWVGWHVFSRLIRRNTNTPYHVAKQNPDFKKFDNLVQQRIAYVTYEASNAVDLVPEILDKHLIVGQNKKDIEAVSKVIFDGTMNDIVYGDTELRSKGLNDKQIDLYRRVRQAIDESVEKMAIDVLANSAKGTGLVSLDEILRIKEAVLANGGNIAMFNNAMQQAVNAKIQAMQQAGIIDAAKATKLTTMFDKVAEQMDKVEDRVYDLQDKGYAPLMRFGSYAVAVEDNQGDLVLYELYESEKAQQDAIFDLKKDPRFAGMKINENVLNPNDYQQFTNKGLNPETVMLFANELGLSSDEANQAYLKVAIAQQSALKRLIHRKKVAGFSEDLPRVLSAFVMSNARHSARMLYNGDIEKSIQGIKDGNLRGEAQKVFENMENPQEEFSSMRSLLFHWSMGFSPAFGLVNMTQLSVQTIPELTMYGGARLAHKEVVYGLARAVASLKPGGKEFVDRLPGYMKANYERMRKEGHLDPQNAWLLQGLERGKAGIASGALGGWSQIAGIPAEITETINRRATMYAALEIANKLGAAKLKAKGFDSAYDFAVDVIRATQGTYNKGNRVGLARANGPLGRFGPLIMVFKQYAINLIEQQYRMLKAGEFKAFATSQAYMWFFAGMMGLIGADDLKDILETIFFKLGVAVNVNRWTQERFINAFGKEWGNELYQIFMYGPLSTVSPVDIHGRTSAGNILPATGILHPANAKDQKAEATEALGVSMSWMSDMFDAGGLMMQGHYRDAMVTGAPRYIRDTIQSVEIATTGEMRDKQGRKVMDMTPKDAAAKALQFNPNSNAHRGREAMLNYQDKKVIEKVQSDFSIYLAEAIATNDQPAQDKVYAEIDQWNQRNEKQYEMDKAKITKSAKKRAEKKDFSSEERQTLPKNLEAYVESLKAS